VLLMTVEPGFGGQKLMPQVLDKARELRLMGFAGDIEADGGIGLQNMQLLADSGINVLVMGTAFFKAEDPEAFCAAVHAL
jgi:ribulose-phosphate 3-epimerase